MADVRMHEVPALEHDAGIRPIGEHFMSLQANGNRRPDPVTRFVKWMVCVGGISFAAGFFGPLLLSQSNLGPLLGIFITGPLGALAGALIGATLVARDSIRFSVAWIGVIWATTMVYTWLAFLVVPWAIYAIALQCLVIAASIFLLSTRETRMQLPDHWRRSGPIAIAAQATMLLITLFPPVVRPGWGAAPDPTAPLPSFAFILDGRFDASRHVPQFAVDRATLALAWLAVLVVAIGLCLLIRRSRFRPAV
jgi:hypothetical protein